MSKYRIINNRGYKLDYKKVVFSDGTSNIELIVSDEYVPSDTITITIPSSIVKFDDVLWDLLLLKDVLLNRFRKTLMSINLNFEYLPHARAERRFSDQHAVPLQVFMNTLKHEFGELMGIIFVNTPHTRLDGVHDIFPDMLRINESKIQGTICLPDSGAKTRFGPWLVDRNVITGDKTRDVLTGQIKSIHLSKDEAWMHHQLKDIEVVTIFDDICDGGGTFIPLAKELKQKGVKQVNLFVVHGIFAKGLDIFKESVDKIYVHQLVCNYVSEQDLKNFNGE